MSKYPIIDLHVLRSVASAASRNLMRQSCSTCDVELSATERRSQIGSNNISHSSHLSHSYPNANMQNTWGIWSSLWQKGGFNASREEHPQKNPFGTWIVISSWAQCAHAPDITGDLLSSAKTTSSHVRLRERKMQTSRLLLLFVLYPLLLFTKCLSKSHATIIPNGVQTKDMPEADTRKVVRLYLIRHSETQGNLDGIVLGQSDSVRTCARNFSH